MAKRTEITTKRIGIGVVILLLLIVIGTVWGSYNSLVRLNQGVDNSWSNVEVQYQRRVDLIPNLVDIAQKYAVFEKSTLTQITALRTQWQSVQTTEQKVQTSNQIESALKTILAVAENYPDLKTSTQFTGLSDNLAETENMVAVARIRYNDAVREYNTVTMTFPSGMIAGWFGFKARTYFAATPGSEAAPKLNLTV